MKYNFNKMFLNNCFINLIKFGKIKSNYFRLKKIFKNIIIVTNNYFKKKVKIYLIKINYKKGDCSLLGEIGILNFFFNNILIYEKNR
ncbi:hypothetical protein [Candidatus Carsonella ruddii]|uniref:hypothetical protein n=1 Tax=Carsonella ruddii TaxID=114186 RepID=UPI003D9A2241